MKGPENPLVKILKENRAFAIVDVVSGSESQIVGFPLLLNDEESLQCEDVKLFVHSFETNTQIALPVVLHNEAYTTQIAMDRFAHRRKRDWNRGLKRKDEGAAAVILQEYLDYYNPADV